MTIQVKFNRSGKERITHFVGAATVSENPPLLTILVTSNVWKELVDVLEGSMITALTLGDFEGSSDDGQSYLYFKDGEDRVRRNEYIFDIGYPAQAINRASLNVVSTKIIKPEQNIKKKPIRWKWEGNLHTD